MMHITTTLKAEKEIDASEVYFYEVQQDYIKTLGDFKRCHLSFDEDVTSVSGQSSDSDISKIKLLSLAHLPRLELETFNGDPSRYHTFMISFDRNVDCLGSDHDGKLSRLIQFTSGTAKYAICRCQLIEGEEGYSKARQLLRNRFGN